MATTGHRFKYDDVTILATEERKGSRLVLESWLSGPKPINRSIDLPPTLQALRPETARQKQARPKNGYNDDIHPAPQSKTEPYEPPITRLQARWEANTTQTPDTTTSTLATSTPATQSTRVTRGTALANLPGRGHNHNGTNEARRPPLATPTARAADRYHGHSKHEWQLVATYRPHLPQPSVLILMM